MSVAQDLQSRSGPQLRAILEVTHPITWFPPIWAFACGVVSSGVAIGEAWGLALLGLFLAGPVVCGMSQAANDWCDRHVDAINEPDRPIPSGRIPGYWGLYIALGMTLVAFGVGAMLGPWGFAATCVGIAAAWAYSAEPLRLKRSWVLGPGLVGLSYETLPWFTGAAVMAAGLPRWEIVAVAVLYGIGAHGIMTLNDFKALEGDRETGVRSLPVVAGPERAAWIACAVMVAAQVAVIGLLLSFGLPVFAFCIGVLLAGQVLAMRVMLRDPKAKAPWYNGTGVLLYVSGMMVAAFALRGLA